MSVALDLARRRAPQTAPAVTPAGDEGFRSDYLQALRLIERLHRDRKSVV